MAAADQSLSLLEAIRKAGIEGDVDFLKEAVQMVAQALIEMEAAEKIGAGRYERTSARVTHRNGSRLRPWVTRVGEVTLKIPKLRQGSFFPNLLEPRRMTEKAIVSVIQEAYIHGVSTRKVDELVRAMGLDGVDKSAVSRLCSDLDEVVNRFRTRGLEGAYPYVWVDATYIKCRDDGRVISMAFVVAVGVKATGEREVLGFDLGPSEDGEFWLEFLRGLVSRGLSGVQLVISDAHEGLKKAIGTVLAGATWQRCTVHFMRNILSHVPKGSQSMVAASVRTVFAQLDQTSARAQLAQIARVLEKRFPRVSQMLLDSEHEILAYMAFPQEHWRQIRSTNPLERLNKEIKRRSDVVGIFPNRASALRLLGAVLMEQNDEWAIGRRYFSQESMKKLERTSVAEAELALAS
ncbi:MAG: IS256 family transposase [Ignavibacteriales bacterium]